MRQRKNAGALVFHVTLGPFVSAVVATTFNCPDCASWFVTLVSVRAKSCIVPTMGPI
jgi:hypothetical protein